MKKALIASLLALATMSSWAAVQGTIRTKNRDVKKGMIQWQSRSKSYLIQSKKGATTLSSEVALDDVDSLDIDMPKGYENAVKAVTSGQPAAAIGVLSKIVDDYRMLIWDKSAGAYLVKAYLAMGDAQKAYTAAQTITREDPDAAWKGDLAPAYWQSLLKTGRKQQLENCLRKAATSGDRATSAQALLMRGDIILSEGDTHDLHRKALIDAYLRVALMYTDEPCKAARVEALEKSAKSFEKLDQSMRAEKLRAQAKQM